MNNENVSNPGGAGTPCELMRGKPTINPKITKPASHNGDDVLKELWKIVAEPATILAEPVAVRQPKVDSRKLTQTEARLLKKLETYLAREKRASLSAACALYMIDSRRLFRGHENSMKKYGQKWGYSAAYTSRLVQSGAIYHELEPYCRSKNLPLPNSEWQLRSLAKLVPEERRTVWEIAVGRNNGETPTALLLEQSATSVVERVTSNIARPTKRIIRLALDEIRGLEYALDAAAKQAPH